MTPNKEVTEKSREVSDLNPTSYFDALGRVQGRCDICQRENVVLRQHMFSEPKFLLSFTGPQIHAKNPNALTIVVCGTDMNLIAKIKRGSPKRLTPRELFDYAVMYRTECPLTEVR